MSLNASHLSTMFHAGFCQNPSSKPVMPAWSRFKNRVGWPNKVVEPCWSDAAPDLGPILNLSNKNKKKKQPTNQPKQANEQTNKQTKKGKRNRRRDWLPACVTRHRSPWERSQNYPRKSMAGRWTFSWDTLFSEANVSFRGAYTGFHENLKLSFLGPKTQKPIFLAALKPSFFHGKMKKNKWAWANYGKYSHVWRGFGGDTTIWGDYVGVWPP